MIARGKLHRDGGILADYLIAPGANEDVIARPSPHFSAGVTVHEAVAMLEAEAAGTRAKAGLWHASLSPSEDEPYTEAEWDRIWEIYEEEQGLKGHHYVEMTHVKKRDGSNIPSEHRHRAYSRVPPDLEPNARPTVVDMKYSHIKNEFIQARAAIEFGREYIPGPNVGTVIRWARDRGDHVLADFIAPYRASAPGKGERRGLAADQSAARAQRNAAEDHGFIFNSFEATGGDRASFEARLKARGLVVERGDKALLVRAPGTDVQYALTRALSAGAKVVGTRLRASEARAAVAAAYADVQDVPRFTPNDHWRQALENPEHLVTGWLTRRESSFTKAQLETRIASLEPPSMAAADAFVAHVLAGRDVVALRDGRYTTRAMISLEGYMTARAALMGSSDYGAFDPAIVACGFRRSRPGIPIRSRPLIPI